MEEHPDPWTSAAIEQNRHWLLAYLLASTGNSHAAEDLVQEIFQIAYEKRHSFTVGTNFGGWLRMIAKNCLNRYFEKSKKQPILLENAATELESIVSHQEEHFLDPDWFESRIAAMKACLNRLTEKVRQIIVYRYSEDKSSKDVAELLGMSVSSVDVATYRARTMLAECIQKQISHGR
jgi:RNA polymerase sigma factor (sigma-70 family)